MINRPPGLILPCLTVCHPVRNSRRAGVRGSCPSSSSSDSHHTRHSGKFVTTDHAGRPPSHWDSPRRVALATTSVRLTTSKMQKSLSIGFSEIFMVLAGVAQEFRSLVCCKKNVGRGFTPARRGTRALTVNQNPAQICVAGRRGVRLARTQATASF